MKNYFKDLVEQLRDEDTSIAEDGAGSAEFTGSIDSGSYSLNAALSGSIFGGVPNNKITALQKMMPLYPRKNIVRRPTQIPIPMTNVIHGQSQGCSSCGSSHTRR